MRYTYLLPLTLLLCNSCSFSRYFYQPDKLDPRMTQVRIPDAKTGDTVVFNFAGSDHKLSVTDTKGQPKELQYSIESMMIPSASGNNVYSWLMTPKNKTPDVTILFLHGNGGNVFSQLAVALPLVKQGFRVMLLDYSGYGFSTGHATRKGVVQDAVSALDALRNVHGVAGSKLVIYGQSMGGQISSRTAVLTQDRIDGLVIEGAPSSHRDVATHMFPYLFFLTRIVVKERYSTKTAVEDFHKPILVVHSREDEVIPYFMGQRTFAHANAPKTFYEIQHKHLYGPVYLGDSIAVKIREMVR